MHPGLRELLSIRHIVSAGIFVALCALAAVFAPASAGSGEVGRWYSVVPPLLAVTLAFATRRLWLSLGLAVFVGAVLAHWPEQVPPSADAPSPALLERGLRPLVTLTNLTREIVADRTNQLILLFIVLMLMAVAVMIRAGGMQSIVGRLSRLARGPRSTQLIATLAGLAVFIDDYANTMIVGASMRPAADRHRISREKLSFIVDATSAPVAGLAVISTWIGYEVGLFDRQAQALAIDRTGYAMFFDILGYRFYCILMIAFLLLNALLGRDFGSMWRAESRSRRLGQVAANDARPLGSRAFAQLRADPTARASAASAIVPVTALFVCLVVGLWIDGGGGGVLANGGSLLSFATWRTVISASENSPAVLAWASGATLLLAILCGSLLSRLNAAGMFTTLWDGLRTSALPISILLLAWLLKSVCAELHTAGFLVASVGDGVSAVWMPALVFVVAGATAFSTGTSWGTMGILIPIAAPIAYHLDGGAYGPTTMLCLASVLDGAILGDHCSPISDTTIMSSLSTSCDHLHHVNTQLPYALAVAAVAVVCGYLPAAAGWAPWAGIAAGIAILAGVLLFGGRKVPDAPGVEWQEAASARQVSETSP